ncbi:hypothetical protein DSO57_1026976 [Entomophthora muscae]|uniref:Uncharacterized protein n=1 Tax=Entomophthora muscae TaxID=34485 RepID=A0ACC2UMZ3_9FUNG|nr:hypothetical protein DSO57_1026976 [Entomophthora muscae]
MAASYQKTAGQVGPGPSGKWAQDRSCHQPELEQAPTQLGVNPVPSQEGGLRGLTLRAPLGKGQSPNSMHTVIVRIDNSFPLETWAQEWDSTPDPGFLQAANPMDQGPARPRFPETEPLQAEAPAKSQIQNTSKGWTMVVPKKEFLKFPNEGRESSSVNFMNLKPSQVTNQIQLPKENTGFRPDPRPQSKIKKIK